MKKIYSDQVIINLYQWQNLAHNEINELFNQQPLDQAMPNNYPYQFCRLLGIDFGRVTKEFVNTIQAMDPSDSLYINVGVTNDNFSLYFTPPGSDYAWMPDSETNSGLYRADVQPIEEHAFLRYGISPQLKDELVYNWSYQPLTLINDLFYSRVPYSNLPVPSPEYVLELSNSWVRLNGFRITKSDLDAFKNLIKYEGEGEGQCSKIKIWFGVHFTNILLKKSAFTIIIEIDNQDIVPHPASISNIQYLEFVQACPPFCGN